MKSWGVVSKGFKGEKGSVLMAAYTLPSPGAYLAGMSKCLKRKHKVFCLAGILSHVPDKHRAGMTNYCTCEGIRV